MLESLFNEVAGLQDYCKAYLLHTLIRFYFSLNKEAYLEPSRTFTVELFLFRLSHILRTYLIRSNCL